MTVISASIMPLAALFFTPLPARSSLCILEALRWVVGGATMTTPGGTRTHHANLYLQHPRARCTGFYHGVGAPTLLGSGPLAQIETFVTFCGIVGLRAKVLGRLGRTENSPTKSVCSILPLARHLRAGAP